MEEEKFCLINTEVIGRNFFTCSILFLPISITSPRKIFDAGNELSANWMKSPTATAICRSGSTVKMRVVMPAPLFILDK
jgi:hypothetical protein